MSCQRAMNQLFLRLLFFFSVSEIEKKILKNSSISETLFQPAMTDNISNITFMVEDKVNKSDAQICSSLVSLIKTQIKR